MKINLPVTGREISFPNYTSMVTKTDTKGIITFANLDFIELSGFTEAELIGSNHNIIRHPDMPSAVFEELWQKLKNGLSWHGIVKNRCKNGDHYWVEARIVPVRKNGEVTGYMSVRSSASREDVIRAERLYKTADKIPATIKKGRDFAWKKHLTIRLGIPVWIFFVSLMMIAGGTLGITGLNHLKASDEILYYGGMLPIQIISRINVIDANSRTQLAMVVLNESSGGGYDYMVLDYKQELARNEVEIDRLLKDYTKRHSDEKETQLAKQYAETRNRLKQEGIYRFERALDAGNNVLAEKVLKNSVIPLFDELNTDSNELLRYISDKGTSTFTSANDEKNNIVKLAVAGIALSCLILVVCGIIFYRFITIPLCKAVSALENMAEGNLSCIVDGFEGAGEPGIVMAAVMTTQIHLNVMLYEIQQAAVSSHQECHKLNHLMMNMAERSDEQHDIVCQAVNIAAGASTELKTIIQDIEALLRGDMDGLNCPDASNIHVESSLCKFEKLPSDLSEIFEDIHTPVLPIVERVQSVVTSTQYTPVLSPDVNALALRLLNGARIQGVAVADVVLHLNRILSVVVNINGDIQGGWAASQQLETRANEMDMLINHFELS